MKSQKITVIFADFIKPLTIHLQYQCQRRAFRAIELISLYLLDSADPVLI
jgi:hypothetical protein